MSSYKFKQGETTGVFLVLFCFLGGFFEGPLFLGRFFMLLISNPNGGL
jgi:hypothetical protein